MAGDNRKSGIDIRGDVPGGTHFCQFYETPKDLTEILVPYFKAGLEGNEFCMWVTAEPLVEEHAREAMRKAMPDFDRYLEKGQIEILPHDQWYLKGGVFDLQKVLNGWIDKLDHALKRGYDGLRVTGNTAWLEKNDWKSFTEYEEKLNSVIASYRMITICTYSLDRCGAAEIIDVVSNHQFALVRRQDQWQLMESTEHNQAEEALRRTKENFRRSLDDSPLGIRIVTADGELLYANKAILDDLATRLMTYKDVKLEIGGYTDATGTATANQKLSLKRAQKVMDYLISKGVEKDRLTAMGYGATNFIADNKTEEGRKENRRVEIVQK